MAGRVSSLSEAALRPESEGSIRAPAGMAAVQWAGHLQDLRSPSAADSDDPGRISICRGHSQRRLRVKKQKLAARIVWRESLPVESAAGERSRWRANENRAEWEVAFGRRPGGAPSQRERTNLKARTSFAFLERSL